MTSIQRNQRKIRARILTLSGVTLCLIFLILGFMLRLSWNDFLTSRKDEAIREAVTASTLVKETLLDASKIVDEARNELEKALVHGALNEEKGHTILHSAVKNFSIYNTYDSFGLLLLLDANGHLLARSGEFPAKSIDLSDRNYFTDLRDHPSSQFALGRLRKAATTGRMVFHLSMPVHAPNGSFAGVVAIQLDESELAVILGNMLLENRARQIFINSPDGRSLFVYPEPAEPPTSDDQTGVTMKQLLSNKQESRGVFKIDPKTPGFPKTTYATFEKDSLFGTTTWTCFPESRVRSRFLKSNLPLILFSAVAFLGISFLFVGLYRQARTLEKALLLATTDPGTGLPNRHALEIRAAALWKEAGKHGKAITVLFLDIDHFKRFNDAWGHEAGDRVLSLVGGLLRKCSDRPLDFFCRWGGEEFLILLPETGMQGALAITRRIRKALRNIHLENGGGELPPVTISVGIASTEYSTATSIQELIERADLKMLEAKASGRNRIVTEGGIVESVITG